MSDIIALHASIKLYKPSELQVVMPFNCFMYTKVSSGTHCNSLRFHTWLWPKTVVTGQPLGICTESTTELQTHRTETNSRCAYCRRASATKSLGHDQTSRHIGTEATTMPRRPPVSVEASVSGLVADQTVTAATESLPYSSLVPAVDTRVSSLIVWH